MIVAESHHHLTIQLSATLLERLAEEKVFFRQHIHYPIGYNAGNSVTLLKSVELEPYVSLNGAGDLPSMGYQSYSFSQLRARMRIGRYCSLADNIAFIEHEHPVASVSTGSFTFARTDTPVAQRLRDAGLPDVTFPFTDVPDKPPPVLEHDVWIGAHAVLRPGIRIGTGSIIGARSVVTRDVPAYSIYAGNPARVRSYRYDKLRSGEAIRARLLVSKWWEYDFIDFHRLGMDIHQPERFLDQLDEGIARNTIRRFMPPLITAERIKELCEQVANSAG